MITDEWLKENAERINWITNVAAFSDSSAILGTLMMLSFTEDQWAAYKTGDENYPFWLMEQHERFKALGINLG